MFQTEIVEKIKTHILCSVTFSFSDSRAVYQIMWKNVVQPVSLQTTIWRMRMACWVPKATNTHSEYVMLITVPQQRWLLERASLSRCTALHVLSFLCFVTLWRKSFMVTFFAFLQRFSP
jgi:hypothetical protein